MDIFEIVLLLLVIMVALVALARRISIAYPILLVLGGLAIGIIPGLPQIKLDPSLIFVLFLPQILQSPAYYTSVRDIRANARAISLLAIGLVLASMVAVALVAHYAIGFSWASAFVLGAIVAPPDAVAATSIAQRLKLPRRIVTVLEGESLLNDATALVAYRVALVAVIEGTFSFLDAGEQFLISSLGGVVLGIVVALAISQILRWLRNDVPVYIILTFLSGYGTYILAEAIHVSGVLAVVVLGITQSQPRVNSMTPQIRPEGTPVWDVVVFLLNGLIFILIGLQLPTIVTILSKNSIIAWLIDALVICATVILARIVWVFPAAYLPRLPKWVRVRDPFPAWQHVAVISWTGMRGIVSLAAALALPEYLKPGIEYTEREPIIFLTFCVILAMLVVQGLTLPVLIRGLKVIDDGEGEHEELKARLKAARRGHTHLQELIEQGEIEAESIAKLNQYYLARIRHVEAHLTEQHDGEDAQNFHLSEHIRAKVLEAEMQELVRLRNQQVINDEVLRKLQYELDLDLLRLERGLQE